MIPTRTAGLEESPYLRRARRVADPITEYWALLEGVVLWDTAHHRQVELVGPGAMAFVQSLVTRDLSGHEVGQAKYAFMTNGAGGIIGDPVVLRLDEDRFWLNATGADLHEWCRMLARAGAHDVAVTVPDVAPVQIQGPHAPAVMDDLFGDEVPDLGYYRLVRRRLRGLDLVISRTGWGGTDGFEVYVIDARADDNARAEQWWDTVSDAGERHDIVVAAPNHVRRIESGMVALGRDVDESTTPLEVGDGFSWMVDLDQPDDFVGKAALVAQRAAGPPTRLVAVDLDGPDLGGFGGDDPDTSGPLLASRDGVEVATLTSACHSPRLRRNIGLLRVPAATAALGTTFSMVHPVHGPIEATVVPKPHLA